MAITMRDSWTDERLEDFREEVNRRFDEVDNRFGEVSRRFDDVDSRFVAVERRMENGFTEMNARFDSLQRMLLQLVGGLAIALLGLVGVLISVVAL